MKYSESFRKVISKFLILVTDKPETLEMKSVDVSIDDENYEIETFYGCGDPIAKLTEKMEKFTQNDKIFFVLRNISILMHLKELISFKKTWKDLGYDVEILGIDFKRKDLIPIGGSIFT